MTIMQMDDSYFDNCVDIEGKPYIFTDKMRREHIRRKESEAMQDSLWERRPIFMCLVSFLPLSLWCSVIGFIYKRYYRTI